MVDLKMYKHILTAIVAVLAILLYAAPALAQVAAPVVPDAAAAAPAWVQTAGLLGFAAAVLWELRQQRTERVASEVATRTIITKLADGITALLERQRIADRGPREDRDANQS